MMRLLSLAAFAALMAGIHTAAACEMHQTHAALTTAQATPAPVPVPVPEAKPVTVIRSLPVEQPAQPAIGQSYTYGMGAMDCPRLRAKEQTVYLTQ